MSQHPYYSRPEVSNSDLSEVKQLLYPRPEVGDKLKAYAFGTLVDAMITEHEKVDFFKRRVDGYTYSKEDMDLAKAMKASYMKDDFCKLINKAASFQAVSIQHNWPIDFNGIQFTLNVRCKWDLLVKSWNMGGDIKSTAAETQQQFEQACHFFDYYRSRAWYMDIEGTTKDMLIGISKKNLKVFKITLDKTAPVGTKARDLYELGKSQYQELAFKYWMLFDGLKLTA